MRTLCDERGVNSFKMFLAYKGLFQLDDTELYEAFEHCRDLGAVAQVHAENGSIIAKNVEKLLKAGVTGPEGHELSRNEEVEAEAVNRACIIAHQVSGGVEILCIYVGWKSYNFLFFFFYFIFSVLFICYSRSCTHKNTPSELATHNNNFLLLFNRTLLPTHYTTQNTNSYSVRSTRYVARAL